MGVLISRFRKKSSVDLLESVEEEIKELEACNADTELRHRKIRTKLMTFSLGLSCFFAIIWYFFIPRNLKTKLILTGLLVLSPVLYYLLGKTISWYYNRKIRTSHSRLKDLKKEKKRLIDEIMDKETYKVAKEILEKYAPESLPQKYPPRPGTMGSNMSPNLRTSPSGTGVNLQRPPPGFAAVTQRNVQNLNAPRMPYRPNQGILAIEGSKSVPTAGQPARGKSYIEQLFEYLVGDGPNSRYALICSQCSTHNGMVLQEEFEYTAFKCYACRCLNPARKQRPVAPKLEAEKSDVEQLEYDTDSSGSSDDGKFKIEEVEGDEEEKVQGEEEDGGANQVDKTVDDEESSALIWRSEKGRDTPSSTTLGNTESEDAAAAVRESNLSNGGDESYSITNLDHDDGDNIDKPTQRHLNSQIKSDSVINCKSNFNST